MENSNVPISLRYAKLILAYTHNRLTEAQQAELDEWLETSDENLELFEALTDGYEEDILSLDNIIVDTDELLDYWMVAGLIARERKGIITKDEKRSLRQWVDAGDAHKKLYEVLSDDRNLHRIAQQIRSQGKADASDLN